MTRALAVALFLSGCASVRSEVPADSSLDAACPPHQLTSACREAEWPLLRENPQAAAEHLEQSCRQANGWACFELGLLFSRWHQLPRDEAKGLAFFSDGCTQHVPESCAAEALMREAGRGAPRDLSLAAALHARACFLGVEPSCAEHKRLVEFEERDGELTGSELGPEAIARVMRRRQGTVFYCYQFALERDPELAILETRLTLELSIDAEGRLSQTNVKGTLDEPLAWCIGEVTRGFQFPKPAQGKAAVKAEHVYVFGATGGMSGRTIAPSKQRSGGRPNYRSIIRR